MAGILIWGLAGVLESSCCLFGNLGEATPCTGYPQLTNVIINYICKLWVLIQGDLDEKPDQVLKPLTHESYELIFQLS